MARRRVPLVRQTSVAECGAACLAMVLAFHGRPVRLEEVRRVLGLAADAESLLAAARHFGLRGRGVRLEELDELALLPRGAVLHWRFDHFVVLDRLCRGGADLLDPAVGRRHAGRGELDRDFTGVALLLEPGAGFAAGPAPRRDLTRFRDRLLAHRGTLVRVLAASLLIQVFALAVPFLLRTLVDRVLPQHEPRLLPVLSAGLATVVAAFFATSMLRAHLLLALRTRLDETLTLDFLDHLMDLPYPFFEQRSTGDLLMRLNSNSTVREILTSGVLSTILDGLMAGSYLVLLLVVSRPLGLLVLGLALVRAGVFFAFRRRHGELMAESIQAQADSHGFQVQMFSGIHTLKATGAEPRAASHWASLFAGVLNVSVRRGRLDAFVESLVAALDVASPLAVLVAGAVLVLDGGMSLGTMLAFSALAVGFWTPLSRLVTTAFQLQLLGGYLDRLDDVFSTPPEQPAGRFPHAAPLRGGVALEAVSFRYRPGAPDAVAGVTLDVPPGAFVGVVGPSGAGKSTLAHLLVGLYRPTAGRILFDGVDLATLDLRSVRRQIGLVPQQPYVFAASVRENIALTDPGLPFARIVEAARRARLDEEIRALPLGYDTVLGASGGPLSGGQRQRLALARALVHRPALLLLDEATSALDTVTETAVQTELAALAVTRIVVAHRLSTVRDADLIVVLDRGRLVDAGRHAELLDRGGLYAALVAGQIGDGAAAAAGAPADGPFTWSSSSATGMMPAGGAAPPGRKEYPSWRARRPRS